MPWRSDLPDWVELNAVQLPGREGRLSEPPIRRISIMAEALVHEMRPRLDRPYVLFGHSMGALVAFEVVRLLRRLGERTPQALFVSGRRAPSILERDPPIHAFCDSDFVAAMCARYNGIPQLILEQPDMMRLLLPIMRSDIEAIETYAYAAERPLELPVFVYGGRDDPQASAENVAGWRALTSDRFEERLFPGGHFYLQDDRAPLIRALAADLASVMPVSDDATGQRGWLAGGTTDAELGGAMGCKR
jgi:medium-chain acyl-[acyl-carrier-protein] hydrolase